MFIRTIFVRGKNGRDGSDVRKVREDWRSQKRRDPWETHPMGALGECRESRELRRLFSAGALKTTRGARVLPSPELHAEFLGECGEDFLVGGVHFLGFEGAVGGAVEEAAGEGLAVGGECLAGGVAEDVEALEADEQRFAEFLQDVSDVRVGRSGGGGDSLSA